MYSYSQCSWFIGGSEPVTGRHSVMLRPDSVRRVRPPKTTMPKTLAAEPSNQYATLLLLVLGKDEDEDLACWLAGCWTDWLNAPSGDELAFEGEAAEELCRGVGVMR